MGAMQPADKIDPRVERSRLVILRAAVEELTETGYGGFTIESVAVQWTAAAAGAGGKPPAPFRIRSTLAIETPAGSDVDSRTRFTPS